MSFKENLKDEMTYQGLLLKELSAKSGISKGSLSNYLKENASIPSADIAVKIAQALGVSVEYLVTGNNLDQKKEKNYTPEIRLLADKLSELDNNELNLMKVIIDELYKQKSVK